MLPGSYNVLSFTNPLTRVTDYQKDEKRKWNVLETGCDGENQDVKLEWNPNIPCTCMRNPTLTLYGYMAKHEEMLLRTSGKETFTSWDLETKWRKRYIWIPIL